MIAETAIESYVTVTLHPITCGECGTAFAMSEHMWRERHNNGGQFYCPNGHPRVYRETEEGRLRKSLAAEKAESERLRADRDRKDRQLIAAKAANTKIKKRIGNGACPCCGRTFIALGRHMTTQHPDFIAREVG